MAIRLGGLIFALGFALLLERAYSAHHNNVNKAEVYKDNIAAAADEGHNRRTISYPPTPGYKSESYANGRVHIKAYRGSSKPIRHGHAHGWFAPYGFWAKLPTR